MRQWHVLFQKELLESWRNRKWIWVPLVFVLIAVMDPLTYYFLPQILELSGGLPEGTVLEIPELHPQEVAAASLESLSTYGIIILALFTMGAISSEQKSGVTEMVLAKPVNSGNYISAKWAANLLLIFMSLMFSIGLSWYYINLLFGSLSFIAFWIVLLLMTLWFSLFLSTSILFNVLLKEPGAVAACTIASYFLMSAIHMVVGKQWSWFPNQIFMYIDRMLENNTATTAGIWPTAFIIALCIVILVIVAITLFRQKEISR